MKKYFNFSVFSNIYNIPELRNKIGLTFFLILIYRLGAHITLPGINPAGVEHYLAEASKQNGAEGFLGMISALTGGAFSKASLLGLGVMPYITASIIVQLLGLVVSYLQKLQHDGESGRKTINQITRYLTVLICFVQAPGYIALFKTQLVPFDQAPEAYLPFANTFAFDVVSVLILTAGTLFSMWLGERITEKGIGNGVSIIIMAGIIAGLPTAFLSEYLDESALVFVLEIVLWLIIVLVTILLINAYRKVQIEYARRIQGARALSGGVRDYIPLKVNAAGVMPIIFAQAILTLPIQMIQYFIKDKPEIAQTLNNFGRLDNIWFNVALVVLILVFTFFYTAIAIPVNNMADNLKRNGGFVPGVKPGQETADYFDDILSKITFPGAIFLALIAILPGIVMITGFIKNQNFAMFFGGTSLIILVGVAMDTVQQINTYLLNNHYDGLMSSDRNINTDIK